MISPAAIIIDTTGLPALAQTVIATIDAAILNWQPLETRKEVQLSWASFGGYTIAKAQGVDKIIAGYRKLGWVCGVSPQSSTQTCIIGFELPT